LHLHALLDSHKLLGSVLRKGGAKYTNNTRITNYRSLTTICIYIHFRIATSYWGVFEKRGCKIYQVTPVLQITDPSQLFVFTGASGYSQATGECFGNI
jgi:hypothetical protein